MRIEIRTTRREELVDITSRVAAAVRDTEVHQGAVLVYCPHTTAALTINEHADPDVARDLLQWLGTVARCETGWRHCEGNSDAHVKASLLGASVMVPVRQGRLGLGTWQGIFFCEFDGPRARTVDLTVLASHAGGLPR